MVLRVPWLGFVSGGGVRRGVRVGSPKANTIRVRYRRRAGGWRLSSVDAGTTPEGTLPAAPGGPLPNEARGFAASTIGPSAAWRQRDKRGPRSRRPRDSSDSDGRSGGGRPRKGPRAPAGGADLGEFAGSPGKHSARPR